MLLQQLTIQNLLSFGDTPCIVPLRRLNVLIGPNGSGKSNFIDTIELLRSTPRNLRAPILDGGGILEWFWKGDQQTEYRTGKLAALVSWPQQNRGIESVLQHRLELRDFGHGFVVAAEHLLNASTAANADDPPTDVYSYAFDPLAVSKPLLRTPSGQMEVELTEFKLDQSILAQRKDPKLFPEIFFLAEHYERIQIYREWCFGRHTAPRLFQTTNDRNDQLSENFSNLGMMLSRMRREPEAKRRLLEMLNQLYPDIEEVDVIIQGGTVQIFFQEGKFTIPATRLSDGTLRYLCLLVILLQPSPPPLVCIEEPELGLHPDVLPSLAHLFVEASQRMQLVVRTHSDILVDALSATPEDIVICEKDQGQTAIRRLDRVELSHWLEK